MAFSYWTWVSVAVFTAFIVPQLNLFDSTAETARHKKIISIPLDPKMAASQGQSLSAFVLGGTGAVGKEIIKALADSPQFTRVTLIGRRQVPLPTPDKDSRYDKFDEKIIDFDNISDYSEAFKGYDVGFSSLGTTRAKSGAEGFYKVDHDYVVNSAKLAKEGGCKHLHLVSSTGSNKNSYFLYPKTKGEVEEELKNMGFDRLTIYRPALLLVDKREDTRFGEGVLRAIFKPLDFCRWWSVNVDLLGEVMVANTFRKGDKMEVLENKDINALGKGLKKESG